MNIAITGLVIIVIAFMTMYFMDDVDPYQEFFPWVWKLARVMLISGVVVVIVGLVYQTWRFLA